MGDAAHKIALQQQHMSFAVLQNTLKKEKKRQRKYANKNRKLMELKVGDPVYLKRLQRRSTLENKWAPFYRVVEKLSPVTYLVKNELDGTTTKSHVPTSQTSPHRRLGNSKRCGRKTHEEGCLRSAS